MPSPPLQWVKSHPLLGIGPPAPLKHTLTGAAHEDTASSFISRKFIFPAFPEGSDVVKPLVWWERFLLDLMRQFASKLIRMANRREEVGERDGAALVRRMRREDLWAMQRVLSTKASARI